MPAATDRAWLCARRPDAQTGSLGGLGLLEILSRLELDGPQMPKAGPAELSVEIVRIADVEGKIVPRIRIKLTLVDLVKALGNLAVALDLLRPKLT